MVVMGWYSVHIVRLCIMMLAEARELERSNPHYYNYYHYYIALHRKPSHTLSDAL